MRIYLHGHDYKYAVEQMLFTMLPGERPEYPQSAPAGERLELRLSEGEQYTTASCLLCLGGESFAGRAAVKNSCLRDELSRDSNCQRIIKTAIYKAALASGIKRPAWGALTGVRPGKLLCGILNTGVSEEEAVKSFIEDYDVSPERARLCLETTRETLKLSKALTHRDVCLYVGIPFCPTRCSYCSFVSQSVEKSMKLIEPFLAALECEIRATAAQLRSLGLRVISIYFGGGTPTTLTAAQLDALCSLLEEEFDLSALREYTVEAGRPDTITAEKLKVLRAHGVDRLSVNPQTMSDHVLETIGRRHSSQDVIEALAKLRGLGGFAVNMDLIAGLPADTVQGFEQTIDKVLELAPENVTVHTLSLKKGSRIMLEAAPLPEAGEVGAMLDIANARLAAEGFRPYYLYRQKYMSGGFENVGWSKKGYENIYNICIMEELCSIIAVGGGGSTKLIRPDSGRNARIVAPKYPLEYINQIEKTCKDKGRISEFYAWLEPGETKKEKAP